MTNTLSLHALIKSQRGLWLFIVVSVLVSTSLGCGSHSFQAGATNLKRQHQTSSEAKVSNTPLPDSNGQDDAKANAPAAPSAEGAAPLPSSGDGGPNDEEMVAETPVIVSGSYLVCTARWQPRAEQGQFYCSLAGLPSLIPLFATHEQWKIVSSGRAIAMGARKLSDEAVSARALVSYAPTAASMHSIFDEIFKEGSQLVLTPLQADASVPLASPKNLIVNGSFEEPRIQKNDGRWQKFDASSPVPGWEVMGAEHIELQAEPLNAWLPAQGLQWTELDSSSSATIMQVVATEVGQSYTLRFYFAARPDTKASDNVLIVRIAGLPDKIFRQDSVNSKQPNWQAYEIAFTAKQASTYIKFSDAGSDTSNAAGTYLDHVSLTKN